MEYIENHTISPENRNSLSDHKNLVHDNRTSFNDERVSFPRRISMSTLNEDEIEGFESESLTENEQNEEE